MKIIATIAGLACIAGVAACNRTPAENKADQVESTYENKADMIESNAYNQAETMRDMGENKAEAIRDRADNMSGNGTTTNPTTNTTNRM